MCIRDRDRVSIGASIIRNSSLYGGGIKDKIGVINIQHETYKLRQNEYDWLRPRCNAHAGNDESQEGETGQRYQLGRIVEVGNQPWATPTRPASWSASWTGRRSTG